MTPCSLVFTLVEQELKRTAGLKLIGSVKPEEITVNVEGRPPAFIGQQAIVVNPIREQVYNVDAFYIKRRLMFKIEYIWRVRDIPNDQFGRMYKEPTTAHEVLESIKGVIYTKDMFVKLYQLINSVDEDNPVPAPYDITGNFLYAGNILDPIHLYPSYFGAKTASINDKVAGFKVYSTFYSPFFRDKENPLGCA